MKNYQELFEALELLIDNIPSETWESLPPYVEQKVLEAYNAAKDAEAQNV